MVVKRAEAMVDARIVTEGSQGTRGPCRKPEMCNGWRVRD